MCGLLSYGIFARYVDGLTVAVGQRAGGATAMAAVLSGTVLGTPL